MKRKLLLLNLALGLLTVYAGWQLRQSWQATKAREAAELERKVKTAPPPPFTPLPAVPAVVPSGYADIAQKTLFDRSRNPVVPVELPAAPPPPPPKPMPPLPAYYGIMNLGDGPMAILGGDHGEQAVHIGEEIGQFKLVDVNKEEIAFEWDGQTIRKKLSELARSQAPPAAQAAPEPVAAAAAPPPPPQPVKAGPGNEVGAGYRACVPGDTTPAGSVVDGYRKIVNNTPFGEQCVWRSGQ